MTYDFNRVFVPLESAVLALLPKPLSLAALSVIDGVTSHNPSATKQDVLQALYDDVIDNMGNNVSHKDLYLYVFAELSAVNNDNVLVPITELAQNEQSAWLWVRGAIGVNTDDGTFFSNYIRNQTAKQFELRYGDNTTNEGLSINEAVQNASNDIASAFTRDILTNGKLPSALQIGTHDASGVAASVFTELAVDGADGTFSPWAGTILFPYLGVGNFTRECVPRQHKLDR